jgi:cytidine deaminase
VGLEKDLAVTSDELLRALVEYVKPRALCSVSRFYVGTAGQTASGEVFLGVNLEYPEAAFAHTVHAEQFLVCWTRANSASPLVTLAVSAPPCGHCRQFLREFDHDGRLRILIGQEPPVAGGTLLPRAFTPRDLEVKESFFCSSPVAEVTGADLVEAARRAASASYTPYTGRRAGLAVRTRQGRIFVGSALENAAFNPSLPPFQAALVACHAHGVTPSELEAVALCQKPGPIDYAEQSLLLARSLGISPDRFQVVEP